MNHYLTKKKKFLGRYKITKPWEEMHETQKTEYMIVNLKYNIIDTHFWRPAKDKSDFFYWTWNIRRVDYLKEKKEEIWLSPMTKAPTPTELPKGQSDKTNNATKKFDYTAVADRLRTVSRSNYSHPTGVVNRFTGPPSH